MRNFTLAAFAATGVAPFGTSDGGLTIGKIVTNLPHDVSAFVVYALMLGAVAFVWIAGRSSG